MRNGLTHTNSVTELTGPPSVVLVPAAVRSVGVVRAALRAALDDHQWETEPAFRVLMATTEAVANAVEHGSEPGDLIEVTYQVTDVQCFVRVLDGGRGRGWHPPDAPRVPPTDAERGRGLVIIESHTQHVEARRSGTGSEIRMNFSRDAHDPIPVDADGLLERVTRPR